MKIKATFFGETKIVRAEAYNMGEDEVPEEILWVERGEDLYALGSKHMQDKKVAIVRREDWIKAKTLD